MGDKVRIPIDIIGGPFDVIQAVLQEFQVGDPEFIVLPERAGVRPRSVQTLTSRELEVSVPVRLHTTVLDMNRFTVGKPGGGGVGVAIGLYCRSKVKAIPQPKITVHGERSPVVEHLAQVMKASLSYPGGFEIETQDHGRRHIGLGSTAGVTTATCIAINEILGRPFNNRELRRIIGYNYCEESPTGSGHLIQAFETGIGAMTGIHGGWLVGTDDLEMVYRVSLPGDAKVIIVVPDVKTLKDERSGVDTAAESEVSLLLKRARYLDARMSNVKSHWVLLDMIPAMIKGDMEAIGDAMLDLSFTGSKRAEASQHGAHGSNIYHYLGAFKELGAEIAAMSSVGPTTLAITRKPEVVDRIMNFLADQKTPENRILQTHVDNVGARIVENGEERTYASEPWNLA